MKVMKEITINWNQLVPIVYFEKENMMNPEELAGTLFKKFLRTGEIQRKMSKAQEDYKVEFITSLKNRNIFGIDSSDFGISYGSSHSLDFWVVSNSTFFDKHIIEYFEKHPEEFI